MAIIAIFSGLFCREDEVLRELVSATGYQPFDDKAIVSGASRLSGISPDKIMHALSAKTSIFNKFNHEKESSISFLKLAVAHCLGDDGLIVNGFSGMLVPRSVRHVLRTCLIADLTYRTDTAAGQAGLAEGEAIGIIRKRDEDSAAWTKTLFGNPDPWDAGLYDLVIPTDKKSPDAAAATILESMENPALHSTEGSRRAVADFVLGAEVEVSLVKEGHHLDVTARDGDVTLTINKPVLMFNRLEDELKAIVEKAAGVKSVSTVAGKDLHRSEMYRKFDSRMPAKVLLVDDEREFVETLSERLQIRDVGAAVTYDGQTALELIDGDEPEVMIIDLKMPGVDGMEVLRKVKSTRPEIEVIVLTGHGSEADKEVCMQLGAFAYLRKPADIDELSAILKKANEKVRQVKPT